MPYADAARRLPSTSARWRSPEFRAELTEWVTLEVGEPISLEPLRDRPWSTVWRVQTAKGLYFAKQNCEPQSFEAALMVELNALAGHHVVPLTAVDLDRGLLMTPDRGPTLQEAAGVSVDVWCRVVAAGAALQREVVPYVDRMAAAGLITLALGGCVAYAEQRLDHFDALAEESSSMSPDHRAELRAQLPNVARWVDQVAALGLPTTLVHNDLHGDNVFEVDGDLQFFDFGDAMLMDPLAVLLVPLNVLAHQLSAGPDDPRLLRVADAGLEVWSDVAPIKHLRAALPAALQLARLGRAESWFRCAVTMDDTELAVYGDSAGFWLHSLTLDPPVGRLQC